MAVDESSSQDSTLIDDDLVAALGFEPVSTIDERIDDVVASGDREFSNGDTLLTSDDIEVIDLEKEVETGSSPSKGSKLLGSKIIHRDVDEDSNSVDAVPSITSSGESESVGSSPKRAASSASSASDHSR